MASRSDNSAQIVSQTVLDLCVQVSELQLLRFHITEEIRYDYDLACGRNLQEDRLAEGKVT